MKWIPLNELFLFAGMLLYISPDEFNSGIQMFFHRGMGDPHFSGDFIQGKPLLGAQLKDLPFLFG